MRGVNLGEDHVFFEPLWTNFLTGTNTGILDWYTCGTAILALVAFDGSRSSLCGIEDEGSSECARP